MISIYLCQLLNLWFSSDVGRDGSEARRVDMIKPAAPGTLLRGGPFRLNFINSCHRLLQLFFHGIDP